MWKSTIKIAYQPMFTHLFKKFIINNVNPGYENEDSKVYSVDFIEEAMRDSGMSFMEGDKNIIEELGKQEIEYVEF